MDYAIPQLHDGPPKLLWWDFDQGLVFMVAILFGILSDLMLFGVAVGVIAARWYGRHKSRKHRMYIAHLMYWFLPGDWLLPCPQLPPSSVRQFIG
ncbi:conjugal transfer pilus assembly protein TraL [Pseudoduganella lurida]|uniref:Conjugal transfer pilus assembly protein TraL n=1 Tax=Pseudoduganella lurida TaxID=1036180 RepID=A0A562RLF7_9BURK|nr:type IV conjugative transfer system protein TraL [Pseudoduganella lurida]TWI69286.1 conjugal transfer pilus assembly protein TraL [Pseudoduganella lurida]